MKNIISILALSVAFICLCNARAEIVLNSEEQMKALPRIFQKKFPPFRPPNEDCHYIGKRVMSTPDKGDFWFIVNTCAGSAGAPMSIALATGTRVSILLETSSELGITVKDEKHDGLPDLEVYGGDINTGAHFYLFRYNGKSYAQTQSRLEMTLPSQASWTELPATSRDFLIRHTQSRNCVQRELAASDAFKAYHLAGNQPGADVYIVTSACPENGKMPVWGIADGPQPRIIFHTTTTRANEEPTLRIGPDSGHGLSDICILNDMDKPGARCWRYGGATYRPKAP
jgi:hypothetical protein